MCGFNHTVYDTFMAPLENDRLITKRKQILEDVAGKVLEIGFGTGANLKFYPYEQLDSLTLLDTTLPKRLSFKTVPKALPLNYVAANVEKLPFPDDTFDSVVFTLVFCSVKDPMQGLSEIRRVLKPKGRLYFIEHVKPIDQPYRSLFEKATPTWKKIAHGCHLNRDTILLIQQAGLQLEAYHRFYKTSFVSGVAVKHG